MTRSNNYLYIISCTIIATCLQYYFISLNIGDHAQYADNIYRFSNTLEEVGRSEKSWFYIFIFVIATSLNFSPLNVLGFLALASYAGTLFVSIRHANQRISTSTYLASFTILVSPTYIFFFLSNYRSGVAFAVCLFALIYLKSIYTRLPILIGSVFLHKVAVFVIIGFALHLFVSKIFGKLSFVSWSIILFFVSVFIVIFLKNGYGPFGTIIESWASGTGYTLGYFFVLLMYCRLFWVDHPLWVAALLSLLFAFCAFLVDMHAVRLLNQALILCLCGTFLNNKKNLKGKYFAIYLLNILTIYHFYLIMKLN